MGFFALYAGFIYNDFLSINLNLFGSCYESSSNVKLNWESKRKENCVYIFGLDPIWGLASNEISFVNSLKMKLGVILGVAHMTLG